MPLYLLGYLTKQYHLIEETSIKRDLIEAISLIGISVGASYIYSDSNKFFYQMTAFYIVIISASYGFLFLCKVLNGITIPIIVNISNGTLMIMGLHWMYIGTTNYILEHLLSMNTGITYSWPIAILFALAIDAAIYPLIIFAMKHLPILLGK
jgi:hypothetical protein